MKAGKDAYCEKPMTRTVEEAKKFYVVQKTTNHVAQIGSQTTSSDQWWKARKAIQDGMIGQLLMCQGSYHRNSIGVNGTGRLTIMRDRTPKMTTTSTGRCGWVPRRNVRSTLTVSSAS